MSVPSGTGKTHLLTGLAVAACRQKRRVRFTTAAGLVNELVEAKHQLQLGRVLARWAHWTKSAMCPWPKWVPNRRLNALLATADFDRGAKSCKSPASAGPRRRTGGVGRYYVIS